MTWGTKLIQHTAQTPDIEGRISDQRADLRSHPHPSIPYIGSSYCKSFVFIYENSLESVEVGIVELVLQGSPFYSFRFVSRICTIVIAVLNGILKCENLSNVKIIPKVEKSCNFALYFNFIGIEKIIKYRHNSANTRNETKRIKRRSL